MPDTTLPTDSDERKDIPLATGCLYYFPAAFAAVAKLSKVGNDKHNPGEELHHARGKSMDHADTILRHQVEAGSIDTDGVRHSTKVAWRALAQLQEELEREEDVPLARGARLPGELARPRADRQPHVLAREILGERENTQKSVDQDSQGPWRDG